VCVCACVHHTRGHPLADQCEGEGGEGGGGGSGGGGDAEVGCKVEGGVVEAYCGVN
jgi:hypothetical protein